MARTVSVAPDSPERNVAPEQGEATAQPRRDRSAEAAAFLSHASRDDERADEFEPIHPPVHGRSAHESDEITAEDDAIHIEFAGFDFDGTKLKAPEPRPGYVQRWLKVEFRDGTPQAHAEALARRRGWKPREASTVQDSWMPMGAMDQSSGDGYIRVGGMLLVEREQKIHDAFRAHYKGRAHQLAGSVDRGLAEVERRSAPLKKASAVQVFGG